MDSLRKYMLTDEQPLRVVCFGDSLTLGFQSPSLDNATGEATPYGEWLQRWMGQRGTVSIRGTCGETTKDMLGRYTHDVLNTVSHCVIILGGTNDLGWGIAPEKILTNLSLLYAQALDKGIQPVAVTVPSIGRLSPSTPLDPEEERYLKEAVKARVRLNQGIQDLAYQWQLPFIDLFVQTSQAPLRFLAPEFSNDGLHLTTAGYSKLAELVWEQVLLPVFESSDPQEEAHL